jgi:REP element-mobilizing transposase RayT
MSGDRYYITDQHATYFLTFTVVDWIDVFTRPDYKTIITDALNYRSENKGWEINAWVLMSNHLHLVVKTQPPFRMSDTLRDFKKFTSKKILEAIKQSPESRREWLLDKFSYHARISGRAKDYKLWRDDNHAIYLDNATMTRQRIDYIHENPVVAMIVANAEDYLLSSANVYAGSKQTLVRVSFYDEEATVDAGPAKNEPY